jgi:tRNA pseudouridine(38-40) synthase
MLLVKITYSGLFFNGSQIQKDLKIKNSTRTVQGILEKFFNCKISLFSRTDRYVSAKEQLIIIHNKNINIDWLKKFNNFIYDIKIIAYSNTTLNPLKLILSREYNYFITYSKHNINNIYNMSFINISNIKKDIIKEEIRIELKNFIGLYDFKKWSTKTDKLNTYRIIFDTNIKSINNGFVIFIRGNGFLRKMVRNIVSYCIFKVLKKYNYTLLNSLTPYGLYLTKINLSKKIPWIKII